MHPCVFCYNQPTKQMQAIDICNNVNCIFAERSEVERGLVIVM